MSERFLSPAQSFETLTEWGTQNLTRVIAIDSQSNEASDSIPSTEGQRVLSDHLADFFGALGFATEQDDYANLVATIPSNLGPSDVPALALMVHMDTSEGTLAVPQLEQVPAWDGSTLTYPDNPRLHVSAETYPDTVDFVGEDVLHGPGACPVGLDDKLGMSELMTLAQVLHHNPAIPHGEVLLVFRPDEEIGRMAAVEGLADTLRRRGVRYGYTVDGITPFDVNVENFNAVRARVTLTGPPLAGDATDRLLTLLVRGVKTHGATAKAEGYLNATLVCARALEALGGRDDIALVTFESDPAAESNARVGFRLSGDARLAQAALMEALEAALSPHAWRGAGVEIESEAACEAGTASGAPERLVRSITTCLSLPGPRPVLSEDSEGYEGYTNPHFISGSGLTWALDYRLRDFDPELLIARIEHVRRSAAAAGFEPSTVEVTAQYVNMGPALAKYPELAGWAVHALEPLGFPVRRNPIRGGTGVDPFLERGIPVANLGTGYFAPESEKELTSRQKIGQHAQWLVNLVQVIAWDD